LGNIADTVYDFNEGQYEKSAKAALGIEFPVGEDWWPDARDTWRDRNYDLIRSDLKRYVSQVNDLTERAVTSGWSLSEMTRQMMAVDSKMSEGRARFVARDQIGKLNGHITQRRMESAGLSMYIWSTSGDERVRGDPGGFFPNADSSHYAMDGLLCRWDDPTVYSDDGGKTWRDRPSGAVKLHPGDDYQCRCTALAYWNEIVDEVDEQIDLLSENVDNIPDTRNQELLIMNPPSARSENETLKAQAEAREVKRRQSNAKKAKQFADQEYPGEKWEILEDGIIQSSRRKTDATTAADELRDAQILRDFGSTVYLVPEINTRTKGARNYDAIVNGMKMEFKTLSTKNPKTLRDHFWDSRGQAPNVFINLENSPLTRRQVVSTLYEARNNPEYATHSEKNKGGRVILKIKGRENLIYINVDDLKVPEQ
jgi:hypothetical protein